MDYVAQVDELLKKDNYIFTNAVDALFVCYFDDNLVIYVDGGDDNSNLYFEFEYDVDAGIDSVFYRVPRNRVVFNHLQEKDYKITIN